MNITSTPSPQSPVRGELYFSAGIPGFPSAKVFSLRPWGGEPTPFYVLESHNVQGLCFVAVSPAPFFPWYDPPLGPEVLQAVDADSHEDLDLLVFLTLHSLPQDTTANLLGPVVVNARTGQAVQAVLAGPGYDPQTPIRPKAR